MEKRADRLVEKTRLFLNSLSCHLLKKKPPGLNHAEIFCRENLCPLWFFNRTTNTHKKTEPPLCNPVTAPRVNWLSLASLLVCFYGDADAKQVPVTIHIINPRDGRPEFVVFHPIEGEGGLFTAVHPIPFIPCGY